MIILFRVGGYCLGGLMISKLRMLNARYKDAPVWAVMGGVAVWAIVDIIGGMV